MIASICRTLRRAHSGDTATPYGAGEQECGLTRSNFLRVMAVGMVSAGVGATAGKAFAAKPGRVAPVTDIDKLYDAWQERFNAADVEGLVDLYVSDVTYINPEGKELPGKSGARADFLEAFKLKPQIVIGNRKHLIYHDIALTTNHWKMKIPNADGTMQELTGGGIEVLRKQADGGWRYIIDDASRSAS